jgi:hypothetical protein
MNKMNNFLSCLVFICLTNSSLIAQIQKNSGIDIMGNYTNHIIDSCLLMLYPDTDEHVLGSGRNYRYLSFRLAIENRLDTVRIINFGENTTHRPCLMLLLILSNGQILDQSLLCQRSLDSDLVAFKRFFDLHPIREKYQLEIMDIWIQSRKGIIKTDCYIH